MEIPKWLQPKEEPLRLEYDEYITEAQHSDEDVAFLMRLTNPPKFSYTSYPIGPERAFTLWNSSNIPAFQRNKTGR